LDSDKEFNLISVIGILGAVCVTGFFTWLILQGIGESVYYIVAVASGVSFIFGLRVINFSFTKFKFIEPQESGDENGL
jgi:hypothetical protein